MFLKKHFTLNIVAIAATGGLIASCAAVPPTQTQVSNTPASNTHSTQGMPHNGMNHAVAMNLGPADEDYDLRLIDAMIPHHQGAVEMAQEALDKSQRSEIRELSAEIIEAQQQEITQLQQWRQAWYPQASNAPVAYDPQTGETVPMSQQQMHSMMMHGNLGAADNEFDLRFSNAMIPHHEGAVEMAQDALNKSQRPEIRNLAQEIINSQETEIKQMQEWQQAWYKQ
ncbi:DUF305 domain-containing protein [Gloeocapsopsis dulcis]|uniref:DUF305 domain-containing protein n=2 Tax=Gloeocapsopsis TaxID=693222 RepID=A0A6N8FY09_9CHRO|nr:DUF305 domain-containing protein [Gloeocapsopsis dulcis]MUL37027.1 DUF305 domain-containing protein [Gloeocapsopsis dulcis AAB1 = 1H9]WNN87880.1 DUF305 domain-containing protein [Gloeocapsopsis dulcis]